MTTLPQTTPLRLPRPATTQLAIPSPVLPGPVSYAAGAPQLSGADVWRVLRSNLWLIIVLLIVSGATGYGINKWLEKYYSKYTATGMLSVQIPDSGMSALGGVGQINMMDASRITIEAKSQANLLRQSGLWSEVFRNSDNIRKTQWWRAFNGDMQTLKGDLGENLGVNHLLDTNLLEIRMTGRDPVSCKIIVEEIVNQHMIDQRDRTEGLEQRNVQNLEQARTVYSDQVAQAKDKLSSLESKLSKAGVFHEAGVNILQLRLSMELSAMQKLQADKDAAMDEYSELVNLVNSDQDPPIVAQALSQDPTLSNDRHALDEIDMQLQSMAMRLGPENPSVQQVQMRRDGYAKKVREAEGETRVRFRDLAMEEVRQKVSKAQGEFDATTKEIAELNKQVSELSDDLTNYAATKRDLESYEKKLSLVQDQIEQIRNISLKRDLSSVVWAAHPETPEIRSFPKLWAVMTVSVLMGLVLALGIAFARELMDTSIRSPRDISRVGNLNLLGMISHEDDDPQSAGARLPVVIFEAPHSMMAEQLRQVRTRLQHCSSLDTMRSILVTSPSPGDGKSTLACNLASGLALNGRRILLVDANFRRPELHRVFNLSNEQGFSDVLNSVDLFEHTVQETQVPNLYVLPSGPKPTNATELLESQLLVDFTERALEEFDHVIFDSGPLLFVSETVALAPRVDGVISVVRARTNTRGVLSRMRDILRQVKAEHLGVVLNAVRAQGGGYYGRNIRTYYEYQNGGHVA